MATSYPQPTATASFGKGGATPYSTLISGDIQPDHAVGGRKLLDQFRDKMRSLHYALRRKYPNAERELAWQYVFFSEKLCRGGYSGVFLLESG